MIGKPEKDAAAKDGNRKMKRRSEKAWLLPILAMPVLVVLLLLGSWQVQRLFWKEALLDQINQQMTSEPAELDEITALHLRGETIDYRPVHLSGTFINDKERHYFGTWEGVSGFFIHTPLNLDNGKWIFVNRGFVPYDFKAPETRMQGQIEGLVEITGLAREAPASKPSLLVPDNDRVKNVFYWKDLPVMAQDADLAVSDMLPFYVDAGNQPNPGGLPLGGTTFINLPNNHLQYAITWYGLAVTLVGVLGAWFWRRRQADVS